MNSSLPYLKRRTYNTTSVRTDELKFTPKIHCTLLGGTHTELNTICRTRFIGEKKNESMHVVPCNNLNF